MKRRSLRKTKGGGEGQKKRFESRNDDGRGRVSWTRREGRRHVRLPAASE